ncbi:unnamed protein product [Calypogeia fissa]
MATISAAAVLELKAGAPLTVASGAKFASSACEICTSVSSRNSNAKFMRYAKFAAFGCELTSRKPTENIVFGQSHGSSVRRKSGGSRHSRVFSSRQEIPSEILEDSKFVPITADDPRFGPPAILLLGFANEEALKVQSLLKVMEGDFVEVLLCTEEMAKGTLGQAFDAVQPNLTEVQVAKGLPRISFLSGLTGEEIMMMIQIFPESGLEPTVFAAHVPLNSEKTMQELMEEIMDDDRRLNKEREPVEQES